LSVFNISLVYLCIQDYPEKCFYGKLGKDDLSYLYFYLIEASYPFVVSIKYQKMNPNLNKRAINNKRTYRKNVMVCMYLS